MKISIIGTGNVGSALGSRWCKMGHTVVFGSRNPNSVDSKKLSAKCNNARITDYLDAVNHSNIILLATPWSVVPTTMQNLGNLDGKIIIDPTNPLTTELTLQEIDGGLSAAEYIANLAPNARVVKAFNTTGAANMLSPMFGIEQATMFICGNDMQSKKTVKLLAFELGFEVVDAGSLAAAKSLEYMAALWINLAYKQGLGHDIAFKLLKR